MSASFETVRAFHDALAESERQAALDRMSRSALELGLYDRNEMSKGGYDE